MLLCDTSLAILDQVVLHSSLYSYYLFIVTYVLILCNPRMPNTPCVKPKGRVSGLHLLYKLDDYSDIERP